ncbi:MAG: hypothetical protein KDE15_12065 [Erythrobacter sp.]|nr:hypothetical protein [Erythrobacter sp.]
MLAALLLAMAVLGLASPAQADVQMSFYSITGSLTGGRYPHAFVVFDGTLADGTRVNTNYGFSARYTSQAITYGPAEQMIQTETPRMVARSNRHFTVTVSDRQYRRLLAEVIAWRDYPGPYYDLDERNCIHFVARLATLVGLHADVPYRFIQEPKEWLNYVGRNNPQVHATEIP